MKSFSTFLAAVALSSMFVSQAATAMTVQPVVIDMKTSGREMSQVVTVENTFANPLPVELSVQELQLTENGVSPTGKDPGDLLVFPPQAMIEPGQTQSFRVQYVGDPALASSKHYYITVAQLPVKLPEGQSAIQILYNFQVLASVAPAGAKPRLEIRSAQVGKDAAGKPVAVLSVANPSAVHGYLSASKLRIIEKDTAGKEQFRRTLSGPEIQQTIGFGLVGANQTRTVTVPVELPLADGTVEASISPEG
ncbi:fimbrial biogenesis chaperone [Novosphingobium taihuense]|uniref:P pilus assembly chaperone PapD n=1 Tax=Novosphingobium taihuense TaxID=260085 RepID=A0A7W7EVT2_9SPHN|nr:fimbria/pilus periplasmic chaperone [Novosphingobium taihuense]MBB4613565.1 P pilus assembly chaperone PapD [Novosphingobium taihuense]TWH81191.1 P pilus assembly chaperone PapD [Novosphingobium taihuense]